MKLFAIIEEKENDKVTQLYVDEKNGEYKLSGFTVNNGKLEKPSDNVLDILSSFNLGPNRKNKDKVGEYDVVLDLDSGLEHFFKDGKEDFEKLFMWNGRDVSRAISGYKPYKGAREFIFHRVGLTISAIFLSLSILTTIFVTVPNINLLVNGERINLVDSVAYIASFEENKFEGGLNSADIKDYIYNKSNISNDEVKSFLWNPELTEKVLPCYNGTFLEIVSKIRHYGLNIQSSHASDERIAGEYGFDNSLFVRNYNEEEFTKGSDISYIMAHEYIHLLQTNSAYPFVEEPCAELVMLEYYKGTSCSMTSYSYSVACKYLRVLMEIIGPEPIWDNSFRQNSTLLDESVMPYLNEEEFMEFKKIMNMHPYHQRDTLTELYSTLENLLDTMHKNKFGYSMYEDGMIEAILNDTTYSRVYFRDSLREQNRDYYEISSISIEEALKSNSDIVVVYNQNEVLSLEEYLSDPQSSDFLFACMPGCYLDRNNGQVIFEAAKREYVEPISKKLETIIKY